MTTFENNPDIALWHPDQDSALPHSVSGFVPRVGIYPDDNWISVESYPGILWSSRDFSPKTVLGFNAVMKHLVEQSTQFCANGETAAAGQVWCEFRKRDVLSGINASATAVDLQPLRQSLLLGILQLQTRNGSVHQVLPFEINVISGRPDLPTNKRRSKIIHVLPMDNRGSF